MHDFTKAPSPGTGASNLSPRSPSATDFDAYFEPQATAQFGNAFSNGQGKSPASSTSSDTAPAQLRELQSEFGWGIVRSAVVVAVCAAVVFVGWFAKIPDGVVPLMPSLISLVQGIAVPYGLPLVTLALSAWVGARMYRAIDASLLAAATLSEPLTADSLPMYKSTVQKMLRPGTFSSPRAGAMLMLCFVLLTLAVGQPLVLGDALGVGRSPVDPHLVQLAKAYFENALWMVVALPMLLTLPVYAILLPKRARVVLRQHMPVIPHLLMYQVMNPCMNPDGVSQQGNLPSLYHSSRDLASVVQWRIEEFEEGVSRQDRGRTFRELVRQR